MESRLRKWVATNLGMEFLLLHAARPDPSQCPPTSPGRYVRRRLLLLARVILGSSCLDW